MSLHFTSLRAVGMVLLVTNQHTHGLIDHSLFGYNKKCSFGLIRIDTTKHDPELAYDVVNIDNEVIDTLEVKRSELSFGR